MNMDTHVIDSILKPKSTPKDAQLRCTDVARVLQQNFLNERPRKGNNFSYSYAGLKPEKNSNVKYEFLSMVGGSSNATHGDSTQPSLPPLFNYNNSLVRETTWYRFKASKDRDESRDSIGQTPKIAYNLNPSQRLGEDRASPDRRKKDKRISNKENRIVNQKFLDYINKKRELTRQLHVDCNPLNISQRPGASPNGLPAQSPNLKREHSTMREKIADFRRWREKEKSLINIVSSNEDIVEAKPSLEEPQNRVVSQDQATGTKQEQSRPNPELSRQNTTTKSKTRSEIQDVRLLKKSLKEHDQRMDCRDSAERTSKTSKESKETPQPPQKQIRQGSAGTWHTWRDVNQSYAYTDVKKYIDENDLMSPSKNSRIRRWVRDVDKHMPGIIDSGELPIVSFEDERMSTELTSSGSSRT